MMGRGAVSNGFGYAEHCSRLHYAVIRVYDAAGNSSIIQCNLRQKSGISPFTETSHQTTYGAR